MTKLFCDYCGKEVPKFHPIRVDYQVQQANSGGFSFDVCADCLPVFSRALHSVKLLNRGHSCPECASFKEN